MSFKIIDDVDTRYLDEMLIEDGLIRPGRWKKLKHVPSDHLIAWCVKQGVYQIPTWELIGWLETAVAGRTAIEICAGRSCLGRYLHIPMSDSYLHCDPNMNAVYRLIGQTPTQPPDDVERLDANEAVRKYKPQVVIGAWVTEHGNEEGMNPCGTNEEEILDLGCVYIHIGNIGPHGKKRIMQRPHLELHYPWLIGRGLDPNLNRIWIWNAQ